MPTKNHTVNRWLLTLALSMNLLCAGALIIQRAQSEEFVRCTAEWQEQAQESTVARSEALADTLAGLDKFLAAVEKGDREKFRNALENYQDLRSDQLATQKAQPTPQPPSQVCG